MAMREGNDDNGDDLGNRNTSNGSYDNGGYDNGDGNKTPSSLPDALESGVHNTDPRVGVVCTT
jgi:hypothetical protein